MSFSICDRGESNDSVRKNQIIFFWCMTNNKHVAYSWWLTDQLHSISQMKVGDIVIGSLVIRIALFIEYFHLEEHAFPPLKLSEKYGYKPLNLNENGGNQEGFPIWVLISQC